MAGVIWFGNRKYMQWVPAPAINADFSRIGWGNKTQFLNGGASVRRSFSGHKEYNMSWNLTARDYLRPITDYAEGIYGDGPIYFVDPMAMDKNLLPQGWATPALAGLDAMPLIRGVKPTVVENNTITLGYPASSATYTAVGTPEKVWLPIPPGYSLWLGFHGANINNGRVQATPTQGGLTYAPVDLNPLGMVSTRVDTEFSSATYDGVELAIKITGNSADGVRIDGMIAQVLPTGAVPATGGFVSGQGHSGTQFESQPVTTAYSAVLDKVGMSAKLVETNTWQ